MHRKQQSLTLGELIQAVARFSRNDHEVSLVVADLMQRGVVIRADHLTQRRQGCHAELVERSQTTRRFCVRQPSLSCFVPLRLCVSHFGAAAVAFGKGDRALLTMRWNIAG